MSYVCGMRVCVCQRFVHVLIMWYEEVRASVGEFVHVCSRVCVRCVYVCYEDMRLCVAERLCVSLLHVNMRVPGVCVCPRGSICVSCVSVYERGLCALRV